MRALPCAAGVGVVYKSFVEKWIQFSIYRVMQESVAYAGFVDVAWLGIGYIESVISAMPISLVF